MEKFKNYFIVGTIAIALYKVVKRELAHDEEDIELETNQSLI